MGSPCEPVEITHTLRGVEVVDVLDVAQMGVGDAQQTHLAGHANVLLHRHAERRHDAVERDGRIRDLLDAMDVAGEAGRDDAAPGMRVEQVEEDLADRRLGPGVAVLVGVGGVRQQQPDALVLGDGAHDAEIGEPAVDRSQVELEVTGVQDRALRGVERGGEPVRAPNA